MADLETLTAQIESRLGEQNQILRNCVTKYQESNKTNNEIAERISTITKELTLATDNLKKLGSQHNEFRIEVEKKNQNYLNERKTMEDSYAKEKAKIEEEKKGQLEAAKKHEANEVARITQEQERLKQKALEDEQKRKEVAEAKSQEQAAEQKILSDEALLKKQQELTEFQEKLKNEQNERKTEQERLNKQHEDDLTNAKTNEEKLLAMQNEINRLKEENQNLNTKHGSDLKSMEEKGKNDLNEQKIAADASLLARETELKTVHEEYMKLKEEEHTSLMENLMQRQEQKVSASANTSQAKIQDLENQLKQCNEKFALSQQLYADNEAKINQIKEDMKKAEEAAGQALLDSVNKLSTENKLLQAQISKMMDSPPPAPQSGVDVPDVPKKFSDLPDLRKEAILEAEQQMEIAFTTKKDDTDFWKPGVEKHKQIWDHILEIDDNFFDEFSEDDKKILKERWFATTLEGGYKHGKSSKKKNKRSLESKLTAKKFSLKKRSKRGKIKGKSKKRRKSIKIRI